MSQFDPSRTVSLLQLGWDKTTPKILIHILENRVVLAILSIKYSH